VLREHKYISKMNHMRKAKTIYNELKSHEYWLEQIEYSKNRKDINMFVEQNVL